MLRFFSTTLAFFVASVATAQKPATLEELLSKVSQSSDSTKVKALIDVANYYLIRSKIDSNIVYLNQALAEAERSGYTYGVGRVLFGIGNMKRINGEYDKALDYYMRSLKIRTELKLTLEAAAVQEAIGRVYISLEKPEKAIGFYRHAKSVYESFSDSARLVPLWALIGDYYAGIKDFTTALSYYHQTVNVYDRWLVTKNFKLAEQQIKNFRANTITAYSFCLIETGRAKEAIAMLKPLLEERRKLGGTGGLQELAYLGYASLKAGDYKNCILYCEAALKQLDGIPALTLYDERGDLNRNLSEAYAALGNYQQAYERFKTFKTANDSLNNVRGARAIAEMQAKYETEKKDNEIIQLTKDKKAQKRITGLTAAAALIALVLLVLAIRARKLQQRLFRQKEELMIKEKEIEKKVLEQRMTELEQMALRAQMNPHFIFNSLNSVQHFVMNKDVEGVNRYLGTFAKLVRQTLNNSGKTLIALDEEIQYLDSYLSLEKMKSNDKFNYAISINNDIDPSDTLIPSMLLQPFVENSILHGVSQKENSDGLVKISISRNGKLVCLIDDNGIGRSQSALRAKSLEHESKGMDITMHRIEAINKLYNSSISVQFTDKEDAQGKPNGTSVKIELPADLE